jgi:hypothetical protein
MQDAQEAAAWYADRSVRAAVRFLDELDRLVDPIAISTRQISGLRYGLAPSGVSPISFLHRLPRG